MSKLSPNPIKSIFLSEIIIVFAMIAGIVPQEFSYLILLLIGASFTKLNTLDSLKLFILSIPFFVALPTNALSDSMSIWRILIVILFLKVSCEKYKFYLNKTLIGCHCEEGRRSNPEENTLNHKLKLGEAKIGIATALMSLAMTRIKDLTIFQFLKQITEKTRKASDYRQKILKQVQNDKIKLSGNYYKLLLLTTLFFIIALLSLLFAQNIGAGVKKILFLANIFFLFPVVIFTIKKERHLIEILKVIFYSSGMMVLIGYFQFVLTLFISLYDFWQFWAGNIIKIFYGEGLSNLLSYSNTWFSYYKVLPPTLRMFSVMPDSHSFAMLIIVSIPAILLLLFYYKQEKQKKYLSIALIFFLLAIFLSGSRGAWMGSIFALAAAIYLFIISNILSGRKRANDCLSSMDEIACFEKNNSKSEKIRLIISEFIKLLKSKIEFKLDIENDSRYYSKLIAFSVLMFFVLMPASVLIIKQNQEVQVMRSNINLSDVERSKLSMFERAFSISDFSETSNKGRLQIWQETLISIGSHPFLGVGPGNFNYILGQNESAIKKGSSAHNIYFDIAAEIGIFGLIAFLFLLAEIAEYSYCLFYKLKQKHLKIFAGSFFVYFVWICAYGLFDVVIFNDKVLIFAVILIGILYSLDRVICNS